MFRLFILSLFTLIFSQTSFAQDPESKRTKIENANIICETTEQKGVFLAFSEADQRIWMDETGPYKPGMNGYEAQNAWVNNIKYDAYAKIGGEFVYYVMGPNNVGSMFTVLGDIKYAPEKTTFYFVDRYTDRPTVIKARSFNFSCRKI